MTRTIRRRGALAEFIAAPLMLVILTVLFRRFLSPQMVETARQQADKDIPGSMEGHAEMDMSVTGGSIWSRIASSKGFTAISHYFVMDWAAVWRDIVGGPADRRCARGVGTEGLLEVVLSDQSRHVRAVVGPLVGPLVAVISFVCSVGNVPLAAVLWNSAISFGGVIAFIYADLIVIPIIDIYRKYYTWPIAWFLTWTMFVSMAVAGLAVEMLFKTLGWVPAERAATIAEAHMTWNYTSVLNIAFLVLAAMLVWRAAMTGGFKMLRMMNKPEDRPEGGDHRRARHAH